jgi:bacterial/archaeal transporter family-2 protein
LIYYMIALAIGFGMAVQSGVNTLLRNIVGEPLQASIINFCVGIAGLLAVAVLTGKFTLSQTINWSDLSWWKLTGGLIGAFYIYAIIVAVPKIGPANMFSLVVAGQVITAIVLDHFGLFGFAVHPLNWVRMMGAVLLIVSVYIIQTN